MAFRFRIPPALAALRERIARPFRPIVRAGQKVGAALTLVSAGFKKLLVLLVVAVVAFEIYLVWQIAKPPVLKDNTVLVLSLQGPLREQSVGDARSTLMAQLQGNPTRQTRLRDVLRALDAAAEDPKITSVLLDTDEFAGAGLASLREVAAAIERVKAAGKTVTAWANAYDQRQYYLAAHASEVFVHPMGGVLLEGLGRQRNYYKDSLDLLGVQAHVLRVGKFKNAGEPFFANKPSPESIESEAYVLDAVWRQYSEAVEKARKLPAHALDTTIEGLPASLVAVGGNPGKWTLERKLVDGLKTRDELRALLIERGEKDEESKSFRQVNLKTYLRTVKKSPTERDPKAPGVAIVVAEGEIVDGSAPNGRIGGDSTAELVRRAREDEAVKAVVLRVNSPGGSAFASEQIRRELELTRGAGKPVIVSMGDVAASGGYWIAMAADEVIADPATITGSIGVFAMLVTAEGLMDKIGLRTGGYRTHWLAGAYDPRQPMDPRFAELVQTSINHIYADFIGKAAGARNKTSEQLDAVAQGRIWTGAQALERGLIDRTGSLQDALDAARKKAELAADAPVRYVERGGGRLAAVLEQFGLEASAPTAWLLRTLGFEDVSAGSALPLAKPAAALPNMTTGMSASGALGGPAAQALADLGWLSDLAQGRRPVGAVVHCLCGPGL